MRLVTYMLRSGIWEKAGERDNYLSDDNVSLFPCSDKDGIIWNVAELAMGNNDENDVIAVTEEAILLGKETKRGEYVS